MKLKSFRAFEVVIFALLFFLSWQSFAQTKPETSLFFHVDSLKARLKLTDGQTAKIDSIMKTNREQILAARERMSKDKSSHQTAIAAKRTMHEKMDKEILAVLTEAQKAKYIALKKERGTRIQTKQKSSTKKSTP